MHNLNSLYINYYEEVKQLKRYIKCITDDWETRRQEITEDSPEFAEMVVDSLEPLGYFSNPFYDRDYITDSDDNEIAVLDYSYEANSLLQIVKESDSSKDCIQKFTNWFKAAISRN